MRQIKGTAAHAGGGLVEGIAVVVHSAQEARERLQAIFDGRPIVLVCANGSSRHEFDLLRRSRGLVVEESWISPGTMALAREFGLPVVTGLGATIDAIRDGQTVFVDGRTGTVEVIG